MACLMMNARAMWRTQVLQNGVLDPEAETSVLIERLPCKYGFTAFAAQTNIWPLTEHLMKIFTAGNNSKTRFHHLPSKLPKNISLR